MRYKTPDVLKVYMNVQLKQKMKECLRVMNELSNRHGFTGAGSAMEMVCARGGINICGASGLTAGLTENS